MRQKLKIEKLADISTIVDENKAVATTVVTWLPMMISKWYHSKNVTIRLIDIKNNISNLSNFKLDNDSRKWYHM